MAKSKKNIVEEWAEQIKGVAAEDYGYGYTSVGVNRKNECFQRIIGNCDAILATLDCVKEGN